MMDIETVSFDNIDVMRAFVHSIIAAFMSLDPVTRRAADEFRNKIIGELGIKISGCINACGHHHIGHIGILGLEKSGEESYQITLGGDATENAAIGERLGPGVTGDDVPETIERIVDIYLAERQKGERFIDTYRRVGIDRFKGAIHATDA